MPGAETRRVVKQQRELQRRCGEVGSGGDAAGPRVGSAAGSEAAGGHTCVCGGSRAGPRPEDLVPLDALGVAAGWGAEPSVDPREALLDQDRVERALATLAAHDREALLLKDVEGFRNDEAAALLGLDLAAFKSRLHRARLRFLAALHGDRHGH